MEIRLIDVNTVSIDNNIVEWGKGSKSNILMDDYVYYVRHKNHKFEEGRLIFSGGDVKVYHKYNDITEMSF